jgi:hypothetical protein
MSTAEANQASNDGQIVIRSEDEAWRWLEVATTHPEQIPSTLRLQFEGWPSFHLRIQGKDWHSTVPSRVMAPLLDVQHDLNRAYALAYYGKPNSARLTNEERENLEIILKVDKGSSEYDAELWQQLTELARQVVDKMDSVHLLIAVVTIALTAGGTLAYKAWVAQRIKEKELDHQLDMSKEESARQQILADALRQSPVAKAVNEDFDATRNRLLKAVKPSDTVYIGGEELAGSEVAEIVHAERERSVEQLLSGAFRVLANDTVQSAGFRIKIARFSDGLTFRADVPLELDDSQKKLIQDAEWSKGATLVQMTLRAETLRGKISDAVVVSAGRVEDTTD